MKYSINRASIESDLNKHHVKYEDPLWDEEACETQAKKNIRISLRDLDLNDSSGKAYEWDIFERGKLVFTLCGKDLTKKQNKYLLSVDGIQHLLKLYKCGYNTTQKIKSKLKI